MLLSDLLIDDSYTLVGDDVDICDIEYDSRKTKPGELFCCMVGFTHDGHDFAQEAVNGGAAALLVERKLDIPVPQIIVKNARQAMAEVAAKFYGYPSRSMKMVGVTGTNGKTTTTYMVKSIAETMGKKVGLIGTIFNLIGNERIPTDRTTPESAELQRILAKMRDEGVEVVVMEVSSHSLDQLRVHGITFDVAAFTNLTQDHLDFHKTFENYLAAKKKLFSQCRSACANADDASTPKILKGTTYKKLLFGIRESADISSSEIEITTRGVQFDMHTPQGNVRINMKIPGLFSVFNAMCATSVALLLDYPLEKIKQGLEAMTSVSGRLEPLDTKGRAFSVLLDYAHTPDALENVLKTIRGFATGRVVTLFGCGGDRDRAKRPIMGEIAGRFSDYLIVTTDNPRSEDPMTIIAAIEEGVRKTGCDYTVIANRRKAISYALEHAHKDDVILLAGKGHETYQEINGVKNHFDEKEIVAEILDQIS